MAAGQGCRLNAEPARSAARPIGELRGEARLHKAMDDLANQLCLSVDGKFDFLVRPAIDDETLEKLAMLINFVLDTARRGMSALREHNQRLAELDQAKTVFFSNASHELRTPLTLILGPMEQALSQPQGALAGEPLKMAHRNAVRLHKLVNTLLDFSRIEAGRLAPRYQPTDLATLTTELAGVFRAAVERAGLTLAVDCPPLPEPVYVDPEMWEKVVLNLLSNAFKFTLEGGITVTLRAAPGAMVLTVRDSGIGIQAAELPRVFERFHRVQGAQARSHEGFGIGLALTRELVRLHGGDIVATSTPGGGSEFRVTLPRGKAHLPAGSIAQRAGVPATELAAAYRAEAAATAAPAAEPAAAPQKNQRARILLADDNADMRLYVSRLLEQHWAVQAVADGEAALEAALREPPDLVLADVMMPRRDGHSLLRALRSNPLTRHLPIVLLSARAGSEAVSEGLDIGADDYLTKPFSARELIARVRTHLDLSRLRETARASAEAANRAKDEFLAMLGHELRNPLSPIVTALDLMALRKVPDSGGELELIRRQVTHLSRLVDDLLDVSRFARGNIELERAPVELSQVVAKGLELAAPIVEERGHQLTVTVPEQGLAVLGDSGRLAQVVSNLVCNAAKYTDLGGEIAVHAERRGSEVVLRVRDTGVGIAPEMLPRIFDLFQQESQSLARSQGGLGLGLAIVRSLVTLHGGSVDAFSEGRGHGSEFVVKLPLCEGAIQPLKPGAPLRPLLPAPTQAAKKVLIVDDNPDAARVLEMTLNLLGHQTRTANEGVSAIRIACEFVPDFALLDVGLPGMSGYDLARALRALPTLGQTKLIAVTGYSQESDRQQSAAAGFDQHLIKPVDTHVLASLLESAPKQTAA